MLVHGTRRGGQSIQWKVPQTKCLWVKHAKVWTSLRNNSKSIFLLSPPPHMIFCGHLSSAETFLSHTYSPSTAIVPFWLKWNGTLPNTALYWCICSKVWIWKVVLSSTRIWISIRGAMKYHCTPPPSLGSSHLFTSPFQTCYSQRKICLPAKWSSASVQAKEKQNQADKLRYIQVSSCRNLT